MPDSVFPSAWIEMSSQPNQGKSLVFYGAVLLVAGSGVALGLNWTAAPLPPMPETPASVQAAKLAAHIPPPVKRVTKVVPKVESQPHPAKPVLPQQIATVEPKPQTTPSASGTHNAATVMMPGKALALEQNAQPKCDIAACSAAYRSFRASDCTWQPYEGPRRFCDKGHPPQQTATVESNAPSAAPVAAKVTPTPSPNPPCDIEACKKAYFTFNPADCTYQPSLGPRKWCDKGHPPPAAAVKGIGAPAAAAAPTANVMPPATRTAPVPAGAAPASAASNQPAPSKPKCNIEACKKAYFTFNPTDCSYQPSNGPRRLCTKGMTPKPEEKAAASPMPAARSNHPVPPGLVPSSR